MKYSKKRKSPSGQGAASEMLSSVSRIELEGNTLLILTGCKSILFYENERITLDARGFELDITGDALRPATLSDGVISVRGKIGAISFTVK